MVRTRLHSSNMIARALNLLDNFKHPSHPQGLRNALGIALLCAALALADARPATAQSTDMAAAGGSCSACDVHPDRCIDACTLLIEGGLRDPRTLSKAFKNRGDAHARKGALDAAADDYGQAMALNPDDAAAVNNRGIIRNRQGRFDDAISDFSSTITLQPGRAAFHINRAHAHHGKKDYAAAVADLDRAITLNPDDPRALNNRAGALMSLGHFEAAIRDLDRAIALDPKYAVAYNNRGIAQAGKGDVTAAVRDYTHALALRPDYAKARENRLKALRKQRQVPAKAVDLPPPEPAIEQTPVLLSGAPEPAAAPLSDPEPAPTAPPPSTATAATVAQAPLVSAPAPAPAPAPRTPVEAAPPPSPPPAPMAPPGPSLLDRFLAMEKTLHAADPATIVRYQVRLRETGHYAGAADGRLSRNLLQAVAACMEAGCALP